MHKRKTYLHLMIGILVLFLGCQIGLLAASDQPEKVRVAVASAEATAPANAAASAPANPSPATLASEINEMRELINDQRRQIEKLQSALEKQQVTLDKAVSAIEAKPQPVIASASAASAPAHSAQSVSAGQEKVNDVELVKGELEAVADSTAQANQRLTKIEADTAAANKKETMRKSNNSAIFTFSGDARVRYEPFFQEGAADSTSRAFPPPLQCDRQKFPTSSTADSRWRPAPWMIRFPRTRPLPAFSTGKTLASTRLYHL